MTSLPIANLQVTHEFTIPSLNKKITMRPYTVREEKTLLITQGNSDSPDIKNVMRTIRDLVKDCIIDKTLDVDNLPAYDIEYLFIKMRSKSVGETINLSLKCTNDKCNHVNEYSIKLDDTEIDANIETTKTVILSETPDLVESINLRYPTINQIIATDFESEDRLIGVIRSCIESIKGKDDVWLAKDMSSEAMIAFINSLDMKQTAECVEFASKMPQLSHEINFNCAGCDTNIFIELAGIQDFF